MHDLDLLVPSALVDPGIAPDLLRGQAMPNLSRMFLQADAMPRFELPPHATLTTWQAWVFGGRGGRFDRVNVAELWAMASGLAPAAREGRYMVEPAHFRIANDHLRLDDPQQLSITLVEARALAETIAPVLAEAGWCLEPIETATLRHWPVTRDDGVHLAAPSIERAIGQNVAAFQPRMQEPVAATDGDAALAWRRCVNEIQMLWFGHRVNEERETRGEPAVNTLWLSGSGRLRGDMPHYAAIDSSLPLLAALSVEPDATRVLETFDRLIGPMRSEDWSTWRDELVRLDERLGAALAEQSSGTIGSLTLVLCGVDAAHVRTLARKDLRKPWRGWLRKPPALVELLTEGDAA